MTEDHIDNIASKGYLKLADNSTIAYHRTHGNTPGVLFLTGFRSDMQGSKALAIETFCKKSGKAFIRFDYFGHGESSGAFEEGTIGRWLDDTIAVIDKLTEGPLILVGSSMGGWLMMLASLARRQRVAGLLGIAAAPDFTEELLKPILSAEQKEKINTFGYCEMPNTFDPVPYIITKNFLEEGGKHLLLDGPICLDMPIRFIHGIEDKDVPWQTALRIMEKLTSDNVEIHYIKNGDHRLSKDENLECLVQNLGYFF